MSEECELSISTTITRTLRSCCTAQWGTATGVVNSCLLSSTPSSSHPLRETLMAGHSERTTAVSLRWQGNQRTDYRFFTMIWTCFVFPENILKLNNCGTVRVEPLCCLDVQPSGLDLEKVFRWDPHNWILVAVKENGVGWRCISMLKHSPSKHKALELIPKLGRNHEGKARGCIVSLSLTGSALHIPGTLNREKPFHPGTERQDKKSFFFNTYPVSATVQQSICKMAVISTLSLQVDWVLVLHPGGQKADHTCNWLWSWGMLTWVTCHPSGQQTDSGANGSSY